MLYDKWITISVGESRRSISWRPQRLRLSEFYEKLRTPARGAERQEDYFKLTKKERDALKDVGGFVAGTLATPRRKSDGVTGRDLITLDLDQIPPGGADGVLRRVSALGCGFCVYSTRKHRPEAPRLRLLLPLDRTVTAEEYEAIARRCGALVGIEMADPASFRPAQMMYWPSASADGEYLYYTTDAPFVSADGLLETFADWRDITAWPRTPGERECPEHRGGKLEDPEGKGGLVGAFCRVYDIPAAMERFLPGVYAPTASPGRYTYTGGSTTGGAVVYENGKFLYSHHATDPCSSREVNAFDLVRLHKFGVRDEDAKPDTPVSKLPSYLAMLDLAGQDEPVRALLLGDRLTRARAAFGAVLPEDAGDWMQQIVTDRKGNPERSLHNIQVVLRQDPGIAGKLRLNLLSGRVDVAGDLPWQRPQGVALWGDTDEARLRLYLEPLIGKVSGADLREGVAAAAADHAYHPIREYLAPLQWDGVPRLDTLLIDYLGAADTPLTRAFTRKALTAAVARVMSPGCKYDTMLVLVGGQGRYKSTILAILGGEWFSDSLRTFGDKDSMESIRGTWINEIAEMQALAKADLDQVKMFQTKTVDYYRAAYARYTEAQPRQCVFFGTTNSRYCLTDPTGGRRFWPVDIDQQPRQKHVFRDLPGERDQIWAEARLRYTLGEPLYLEDPELAGAARTAQEEHRAAHPWEGVIAEFLNTPVPPEWSGMGARERAEWYAARDTPGIVPLEDEPPLVPRRRVCALEIWVEALRRPAGQMQQRDARVINSILAIQPGWHSVKLKKAGKPYGPQRCYERVDEGVTDAGNSG